MIASSNVLKLPFEATIFLRSPCSFLDRNKNIFNRIKIPNLLVFVEIEMQKSKAVKHSL